MGEFTSYAITNKFGDIIQRGEMIQVEKYTDNGLEVEFISDKPITLRQGDSINWTTVISHGSE